MRNPVRRALPILAAILALAGLPATRAAQHTRPNVVVIMTDDQTVEQMKVMEHVRAVIGNAGATFRNSLSSFPLCCPSRATFLTGQYAHNHGVLENEAPTGGYYRLKSENTLPVWLQRAGYRTIHVGKYLNDYGTKNEREIPPGWSEWHGIVDPTTYRMWGYRMNSNGRMRTYGQIDVEDPALYQTDVLRDKAVDAIGRAAGSGKPFFMTFWTLAPHREVSTLAIQTGPRAAPRHRDAFNGVSMPRPPSFNEADMTDKALIMQVKPNLDAAAIREIEDRYRNELESLLAVDEAVAAITNALQSAGVLDNTYVIYTSDNGYFHGEHRTPDEKILGYEPSSRVPLLMRGPGIAPGIVVDELVANVDLAPTIMKLTGARPGLAMDGRSLMPFVRNTGSRTRRPILLEAFFPIGSALQFFTEQLPIGSAGSSRAAASPEFPLPLGKAILPYQAIRTDRYVYIEWATGEHELYDLLRDPWQIASQHLDPRYLRTQLALALRLQLLRLCRGDLCRAETAAIPEPG